ncbi:ROK family protein [Mariniblastus fucicola]|uniref:Glucokinase n=1 Tax=Mariniblastus fucicola TaxID=980251 RepID=A0A5B9PJ72_9BACT|nr:ROK family protein [Mariniblastus fucicola]QEG22603.1 Glucokinase [Mariniblastus fucicola]
MSDQTDDCWIGFDLGGTKMLAVVYDADFKPLGKARKKTKGHDGKAAGLKRINSVIKEAMEDAGVDNSKIKGLGIGCPGPLDLEKKMIRIAPNLGWENAAVGESIEKEFGFPVAVANDVDAGVFGEYMFGAGKGKRCVAGIFPGTGIGGGCVYEGKLIRGANCTCMEIGHIPVMPGGPRDGAGNPGSLEAVASRLSIAGAAALAAYRGDAPHLREDAGTDISDIRSGALKNSVEKGDEAVIQIVHDACDHLALSVVTMVHLMAPDVIVFGGGLIEAMGKIMLPRIEKAARRRILGSLKDVFEIKEAELGDDAGVMGAAALGKQAVTSNS